MKEWKRKREREKEGEGDPTVGARGGWLPNWKRFSVGEGRHQSERSVSKETRRRALVWRGSQAPMGLLGKGAGAQRRYTIERRYQRFLDSPWRTRRSTFLRGLGHPRGCVGRCRVHTWLPCTLCIANCNALATNDSYPLFFQIETIFFFLQTSTSSFIFFELFSSKFLSFFFF